MGCGASSESPEREEKYIVKDDNTAATDKAAGENADDQTPGEPRADTEKAVVFNGTITDVSRGHRRVLKYSELGDVEADNAKRLWTVVRGCRTVRMTPAEKQMFIAADFGCFAVGVDTDECGKTAPEDLAAIIAARTVDTRVRGVSMRSVQGHGQAIKLIAQCSRDQTLVMAANSISAPSITVVDTRRDSLIGALDARKQDMFENAVGASFSTDGGMLATVYGVDRMLTWDMGTYKVKKSATFGLPEDEFAEIQLMAVRYTPGGRYVVAIARTQSEICTDDGGSERSSEGYVAVFDATAGTALVGSHALGSMPVCMACDADPDRVVVGCDSGEVVTVHVLKGVVGRTKAHKRAVREIDVNPLRRQVVTSDMFCVACWDVREDATLASVWTRSTTSGAVAGVPPMDMTERPASADRKAPRFTGVAYGPAGFVVAPTSKNYIHIFDADGNDFETLRVKGVVTKMASGRCSLAAGDNFGNVYVLDFDV